MLDLSEILYFVGSGVLGAIAYMLINSDKLSDLKTYDAFKRYVLGGISGIVYFVLYSEYDFPNSIMCFVSGYSGVSFIEGIVNRLNPKPTQKENKKKG